MRRRLLCCAKEPGTPSDDAIAVRRGLNLYALADGASTSYAGRAWARTLSRRFVADPNVNMDWLRIARSAFMERTRPVPEDWLGEIAFGRGSHATLLGFSFQAGTVSGFATGDTVLFLITSSGWVHHPPLSPEAFKDDPVLLASHPATGPLSDTDEALSACAFSIAMGSLTASIIRVMAMTDGLAAWALAASTERRLQRLNGLAGNDALRTLVAQEVATGAMRRDDATLLIIEP